MKDMIISVLKRADFDEDFLKYITNKFPEQYQQKYNRPYHQDLYENKLSEETDETRIFDTLVEVMYLYTFYKDKGIALNIFNTTIKDLEYRIKRYYSNHNMYGLTDTDLYWLGYLFRGEIYDLHSLRFQIFLLSYKEIERQGHERIVFSGRMRERFLEGTPIINIHILNNADLSKEAVDKSIDKAREFFKVHFPNHQYEYFFCRSWMTYPAMLSILSKESNIAQFINRFEFIASHNNPTQALNRIYGTTDLVEIKSMPHSSSLQKKAYLNIDKLGVGLGIIKK